MRSFSFVAASSLLALGTGASASSQCKCTPNDSCFPSEEEWASLSQNLSHPLVTGQRPLAAVCYEGTSSFNAAACNIGTAYQYDEDYRADHSNSLMWTNFEALIANGTVYGCPFDTTSGDGICHQGRVPTYSINATTVSDIQNTLSFAQEHNLRLVVKNTGHELGGRAFGSGAVELYVHNLQDMQFEESFTPVGCSDSNCSYANGAITIGAGVQWLDVYEMAHQQNRSIAGGFVVNGSVGAGAGWSLGGGHSPLSPFYGLGVDNVLQYTVVLPNTSHVTANAAQNTDLFWALRGGGGPSFGIVTSVTYKTHPNPPVTGAFFESSTNSTDAYRELLTTWVQHHNGIADAGWSGAWPILEGGLYLSFLAQGSPASSEANSTMEAFFAAARAIPGVNVTLAMSAAYADYFEWYYDILINPSLGYGLDFTAGQQSGVNVYGSSWLVPRDIWDTNATELGAALANITSGVPFLVGGGAVAQVGENETAVTPAFRRTISDIASFTPFASTGNASDASTLQQLIQEVHDQYAPLRELAPAPYGGQYLNEPDLIETDWQTAYWGPHYDRLVALKQEIDPNDLLLVTKGVNSEGWDDQLICKTA